MNPFSIDDVSELLVVAWLWLKVVLVFLAVWLTASIPAALLWVSGNRVLTKAARYCYKVSRWLFSSGVSLPSRIEAVLERLADAQFRLVFAENEKRIRQDLKRIRSALVGSVGELEASNRSLLDGYAKLERDLERYENSTSNKPDYTELVSEIDLGKMKAGPDRFVFWMFLFASLGLILLNTLIVNGFFASLTPYRIPLISIPISVVYAIFYSIGEFITGVILFYSMKKVGDVLGPTLLTYVAFLIILIVIVFEVFLYGMISGEMRVRVLEPLVEQFPLAQYWFGGFGLMVGLLIPTMGYALEHSRHKLMGHGAERRLVAAVEKANAFVASLPDFHERIALKAQQARDVVREFRATAEISEGGAPRIAMELSDKLQEFDSALSDAAESRREPYADMDSGEGRLRRNFPLVKAVIFVGCGAALFRLIVDGVEPQFGTSLASLIAVGWVGISIVAGRYLFGYVTLASVSKAGPDRIVAHAGAGALRVVAAAVAIALPILGWVVANLGDQTDWLTFASTAIFTAGNLLLGHLVDSVFEGVKAILASALLALFSACQIVLGLLMYSASMLMRAFAGLIQIIGYPVVLLWRTLSRLVFKRKSTDAAVSP